VLLDKYILVSSSLYSEIKFGLGQTLGILSYMGIWNSNEDSRIPVFLYALYVVLDSFIGAIIFVIYPVPRSLVALPSLLVGNFSKYIVF